MFPLENNKIISYGCLCEKSCCDEDICICIAQHDCAYDKFGILKDFDSMFYLIFYLGNVLLSVGKECKINIHDIIKYILNLNTPLLFHLSDIFRWWWCNVYD